MADNYSSLREVLFKNADFVEILVNDNNPQLLNASWMRTLEVSNGYVHVPITVGFNQIVALQHPPQIHSSHEGKQLIIVPVGLMTAVNQKDLAKSSVNAAHMSRG